MQLSTSQFYPVPTFKFLRGDVPAAVQRTKELAASALAAYLGYASTCSQPLVTFLLCYLSPGVVLLTRKVQIPVKRRIFL